MNGCVYRTKDGECNLYAEGGKYHAYCDMNNCEGRKMSNSDRIRSMTDEELAEKIGGSIDCEVCKTMHHSESDECPSRPHQHCVDFWLDWLKEGCSDDKEE